MTKGDDFWEKWIRAGDARRAGMISGLRLVKALPRDIRDDMAGVMLVYFNDFYMYIRRFVMYGDDGTHETLVHEADAWAAEKEKLTVAAENNGASLAVDKMRKKAAAIKDKALRAKIVEFLVDTEAV